MSQQETEDQVETPESSDGPENLSKQAWITLALFAAFVAVATGCMIPGGFWG